MKTAIVRCKYSHSLTLAAVMLLSGCYSVSPLGTPHLQEEALNPNTSIVIIRFKMPRNQSTTGIFGSLKPAHLLWTFAVSNEATGWNFRSLDSTDGSVLLNHYEVSSPDFSDYISGWATFIAPPGTSYIALTSFQSLPNNGAEQSITRPPRILHAAAHQDQILQDYYGSPRFVLEVPENHSLIYAGTILREHNCISEEPSECNVGISIIDESSLAKIFIHSHPSSFIEALRLQTILLTVPQTHTLNIHH